MLRLKGGSPKVIKPFLKKGAALVDFTKRLKNTVAQNIGIGNDTGTEPPRPMPHLQPLLERMAAIRAASDDDIVKTFLEEMTDLQLQSLTEVLAKKSGVRPENRLVQIAYIMLGDLSDLDADMEYIKKLKCDVLGQFIDIYSKTYHYEKSGGLNLNHEKFSGDIQAVINYRRGIRRVTEAESVVEPPAEESRCTIS